MTPTGHSRPLLDGVAAVLVEIADDVENIGTTLCQDPAMLTQHFEQMQSVDVVAQTARQLAAVLKAECETVGLAGIQLDKLRQRLLQFEAAQG